LKFKDFFSDRAELYATHRPLYPDAFFLHVAQLTNDRSLAVDCGTGNGQAAIGLAKYFDRVIATDPSEAQLARAINDPRVEYRVGRAEETGLDGASVNLVTAAQALHWFDTAAFFREVKRILAPGGAVAVWGYGDPILDSIPLHKTLYDFNRGLLEEYWPPERHLLLDAYRTIDFPFREVIFPRFVLEMRWTLGEVVGYLRTWSATSRYVEQRGIDPVIELEAALARSWGPPDKPRIVRWPLFVRAGAMNK
jgi:SAM-dependent methyltransferase